MAIHVEDKTKTLIPIQHQFMHKSGQFMLKSVQFMHKFTMENVS